MKKKTQENLALCAGITVGFAGVAATHQLIVRYIPYSYRTSIPEILNYVTDYKWRPQWATKALRAMGSELA